MKFFLLLAVVFFAAARASSGQVCVITSPTHAQTFTYGSEQHQQWITSGRDRHLVLTTEFTNDPYVDRANPRQYDNFSFDFPNVRLGPDGRIFYYHAPDGRLVPVATRSPGFLGFEDVKLLKTSSLLMKKPHGYLTIALMVDK